MTAITVILAISFLAGLWDRMMRGDSPTVSEIAEMMKPVPEDRRDVWYKEHCEDFRGFKIPWVKKEKEKEKINAKNNKLDKEIGHLIKRHGWSLDLFQALIVEEKRLKKVTGLGSIDYSQVLRCLNKKASS